MKKDGKRLKKMTLHRETLRNLELREVAGGATIRYCNSDISCNGTCQQATCTLTGTACTE